MSILSSQESSIKLVKASSHCITSVGMGRYSCIDITEDNEAI